MKAKKEGKALCHDNYGLHGRQQGGVSIWIFVVILLLSKNALLFVYY